MMVIGNIIERIIMTGVADSDSSIRIMVLKALDDRFNHHLIQPDNLRSLFIPMNDEIFDVRQESVDIIGRLTAYKPSVALPLMRKILIQLLTDLEYGLAKQKEEAAQLLKIVVSRANIHIKPYIDPIILVLIPKANDVKNTPGVTSKILAALGEISLIGEQDLLPYVDDIMPLIIDCLQDQSSVMKREAALKMLGQLSTSTCWVVEPYLKYPKLLNLLIQILKVDQSLNIRREAVRVMGILGAVDPYLHKVLK